MSANDCLFCKMASGEIKPDVVFQDEQVTAFRDISPKAPTHILLIPNAHLGSTNDLLPEHDALIGRLLRAAAEVASNEGLAQRGYRLLTNCGPDAGQSVQHLHFHLLGGRSLGWPPG